MKDLLRVTILWIEGKLLKQKRELEFMRNHPWEYLEGVIPRMLKMFVFLLASPVQIKPESSGFVQIEPASGHGLHVVDVIQFLLSIRIFVHVGLCFNQRLLIYEEGFFTTDGLIYLLACLGHLAPSVIFLYHRFQKEEICWFFNAFSHYHQSYSRRFQNGQSLFRLNSKSPTVIGIFGFLNCFRIFSAMFVVICVLIFKDSPLLLSSNPLISELVVKGTLPVIFLLLADIVFFLTLGIFYQLILITAFVPLALAMLLIRGIRYQQHNCLSWQKRQKLYVQTELLANCFLDRIRNFVPLVEACLFLFSVFSQILVIKFFGIADTLATAVATFFLTYVSFMMTLIMFLFSKGGEALGAESTGVLESIKLEVAATRGKRLAVMLSGRRPIRVTCGPFYVFEKGLGLSRLISITDNVVSGVFLVVLSSPMFFLGQ